MCGGIALLVVVVVVVVVLLLLCTSRCGRACSSASRSRCTWCASGRTRRTARAVRTTCASTQRAPYPRSSTPRPVTRLGNHTRVRCRHGGCLLVTVAPCVSLVLCSSRAACDKLLEVCDTHTHTHTPSPRSAHLHLQRCAHHGGNKSTGFLYHRQMQSLTTLTGGCACVPVILLREQFLLTSQTDTSGLTCTPRT